MISGVWRIACLALALLAASALAGPGAADLERAEGWIVWVRGDPLASRVATFSDASAGSDESAVEALAAAGWTAAAAPRPFMGDGRLIVVSAAPGGATSRMPPRAQKTHLASAVRAHYGAKPHQVLVSRDARVSLRASPTTSWALDRLDQRALPLDGQFRVPSPDGAGARIYVVDTGTDPHPDLAGRLSWGYDAYQSPPLQADCNGAPATLAGFALR